MTQMTSRAERRAFTIRDLVVTVAGLTVAIGLLASVVGANRDLSKAAVCSHNLHQLFTGLTAYVNQYNSYPPNNPYPTYMSSENVNGISTGGWDPSLGWILTHGLAMEPPARHTNGHFKWYDLEVEDLPSVVVCPAADHEKLFTLNPEIEGASALESFVYRYAAFYQTSGTIRSATPISRPQPTGGGNGIGGRNSRIADPTLGGMFSQLVDNAQRGIPHVYVRPKALDSLPHEPAGSTETCCWIQAVRPSEVQEPARVYYLADSREYRPTAAANSWPAAAVNDGWMSGYVNKIFLGSRHDGYANVMYLDGRVTRDNQTHDVRWNMDYDSASGQARSSQWRCATFATDIPVAGIHTQVHTMPVLLVRGWEYFFDADGVAGK